MVTQKVLDKLSGSQNNNNKKNECGKSDLKEEGPERKIREEKDEIH